MHEIDGDHPSNYEYLEVGHSVQYGENYYSLLTMDIVLDYAMKQGLEVQYEKTMIKLEKNDAGRVTGIIAKDSEGKLIRYNASKGVIVATGGYFICTMDGIQIDDTMHAVDKDYKAIPGLYVIGDCSGNYFSGSYPNLMSGAAAGRSSTFGRLAGKYAAQGIDL